MNLIIDNLPNSFQLCLFKFKEFFAEYESDIKFTNSKWCIQYDEYQNLISFDICRINFIILNLSILVHVVINFIIFCNYF